MKKLLFTFGLLAYLAMSGIAPAQINEEISITLDFNEDPENFGLEFFGSAVWREEGGVDGSGYLSVTDAVNSERGTILIPPLIGDLVFDGSLLIEADLRVGGGTAQPADGFSFNFIRADDLNIDDPGCCFAASPTGEANLPEEGTETGLAIGFDEWFSGGDDVIGMSIRVDNELIDQFEFPLLNGEVEDQESLQTGPEGVDAEDLGWAHFSISLSKENQLVVTYKDVVAFDQQIDYERHSGALLFAGRTGGANANHDIDNIKIVFGPGDGGGGLTGDYDGNGALELADIDLLIAEIQGGANPASFDLTGDGAVNSDDLTNWVTVQKKTWIGDANLDGEFNSSDFVAVFQAGLFETGNAASWAQGDWNGDGTFGSSDFVAAFQDGGFELGPRAAASAVPEPSSMILVLAGVFGLVAYRRKS